MTEPTRLDAPNQQVVRPDGSGPADEGSGGSSGDEQTTAQPDNDLESLTKDDLLAEADARGIDANTSMTKAEIIEAIRAG